MICSRTVFRCFKTLERWGNKVTGAAGPYYVALAVFLISSGILCFCESISFLTEEKRANGHGEQLM